MTFSQRNYNLKKYKYIQKYILLIAIGKLELKTNKKARPFSTRDYLILPMIEKTGELVKCLVFNGKTVFKIKIFKSPDFNGRHCKSQHCMISNI